MLQDPHGTTVRTGHKRKETGYLEIEVHAVLDSSGQLVCVEPESVAFLLIARFFPAICLGLDHEIALRLFKLCYLLWKRCMVIMHGSGKEN